MLENALVYDAQGQPLLNGKLNASREWAEVNAFCNDSHAMDLLYTELHRNVLDLFNEYGVQIMTPAYEGDPEQPKVVPREQWYAAPARPPQSQDINHTTALP